MGNENERKHDPAENRENRMGYPQDSAKTGGEEKNVGLTGDQGFGRQDADSETKQILTGDQEGDSNFGGNTGSGKSFIAGNNSRADLGASGEGSPGGQDATGDVDEDSGDYQQKDGNPQAGFAEQGRGAPTGAGPEGTPERTANEDSDIEGSSNR